MDSQSQIDNNEILSTLSQPLNVGYAWAIQAMAWGGFAFLSWLLFIVVVQEKEIPLFSPLAMVLVLFWLVSVVGIYKFSQRITANNQSIAVVSWFGKQEIRWDEIRQIKIRKYMADMIICGGHKKIIITAATNWRGRDVQALWDYLNVQIEKRVIEVSG